MGTLSNWLLPLSLIAIFVADQALKYRLLAGLDVAQSTASGSIVRGRRVPSGRTMAGRLGIPPVILLGAWLGCLLTVLFVAPHAGQFEAPVSQAALGAALGGAAANLFDLVVRKSVVDYIDVGAWPAFNLADVAIVAGVIVGLLTH